MDRETAKNYLAIYDETYSWTRLSNITGYDIPTLKEMYDEIVDNHEIQTRRKAMRKMVRMDGVFRINPVTFDAVYYQELSQLKREGFNVSNVFYACRNPASLCNGSLWRFGVDVDKTDIERSVKEANPELFIPIFWYDIKTGECGAFRTLQVAHSMGWNKKCIMEVIEGKKRTYKGRKWFLDSSDMHRVRREDYAQERGNKRMSEIV